MGKRRKAREIVLKTLYYYEISGDDKESLLQNIIKRKGINKTITDYAIRLLKETMNNLEMIDKKLVKIIENWDLQRVAIIDKSILRLAVAEILFFSDIPVKVSIDEAVEIAKEYSTENSGRFVNGILDEIARSENLINTSK
ncbi:transcription antitermination factor NusB [candidate division WOR-3 bacterium]|nr:transcription antitermination factor NusB [candidate division WOR-3 bacterium]